MILINRRTPRRNAKLKQETTEIQTYINEFNQADIEKVEENVGANEDAEVDEIEQIIVKDGEVESEEVSNYKVFTVSREALQNICIFSTNLYSLSRMRKMLMIRMKKCTSSKTSKMRIKINSNHSHQRKFQHNQRAVKFMCALIATIRHQRDICWQGI